MSKILFIGGYARAGKTETLNYFKRIGVPCYSTSVLLHKVKTNFLNLPGIDASYYGNLEIKENLRQLLIDLAEEVLVPVFGRELFSHTVIRQANIDPAPLVVVETVGGEEFRLGLKVIEKEYFCWNIRRDSELKGADLRELLEGGVDIWNNGSKSDLADIIEKELSWMD